MATRTLERSDWKDYLDHVSKALPTEQVEIEVAGLDLGDQVEAEWVVLKGIAYDPKDDVLSVFTDAVDHNIVHPRTVYVDDGLDGLHSLEVIDQDDHRHIVRLKEVLKLPKA